MSEPTSSEGNGLQRALQQLVGQPGAIQTAPEPVNRAMIRHWCEALDDGNPVYMDPDRAAASVHGALVAPPAMLDTWPMPGLARRADGDAGRAGMGDALALLDGAGFTSVVATNSEHEYERYLVPGDALTTQTSIEAVSAQKQTALGTGHFVTLRTDYRDARAEEVGRTRLRILKFKPAAKESNEAGPSQAARPSRPPRPPRPRPGISRDTRFFWEGIEAGELRIQRCEGCGELHHPPVVRCPACGAYELGHQVASGRGHLYSFVEVHHPQVPSFDYPLLVALVELEEGTRLIANLEGIDAESVEIGAPLELGFDRRDPEQSLPVFRPRRVPRRDSVLYFEDVSVGDRLPACPVPITRTLIVAGAIASRDYQDVHHDPVLARRRGSPDIFTNIMTTNGLCTRYVTDWAGPDAVVRSLRIRLGVPNYPDDTLTFRGEVTSATVREGGGVIEVAVRGANRLGDHVTGTLELALPTRRPAR